MLLGTVLVPVRCKGFHGAVAQSKTSLLGKLLSRFQSKTLWGLFMKAAVLVKFSMPDRLQAKFRQILHFGWIEGIEKT